MRYECTVFYCSADWSRTFVKIWLLVALGSQKWTDFKKPLRHSIKISYKFCMGDWKGHLRPITHCHYDQSDPVGSNKNNPIFRWNCSISKYWWVTWIPSNFGELVCKSERQTQHISSKSVLWQILWYIIIANSIFNIQILQNQPQFSCLRQKPRKVVHSNFFLPEVRENFPDSAPPNFGLSFGTIWLNPKFGTLISGFALRSVPEFRYILPVMLKKITEFSGSFSMFWDRLPEAYSSKNYRTSVYITKKFPDTS
jgi:hypothetical protein